MTEHGPLAAAGGAAGVEDRRKIIGLPRDGRVAVAALRRPRQQGSAAVVAQRQHVRDAGLFRDLPDPAGMGRTAHHQRRFSIADEVADLRAAVRGVERQENMAGAQRRQVQHHGLDRFLHLHGDARRGGKLQRLEQVRHHGGAALQVLPTVVQPGVGLDRSSAQVVGEGSAQGSEKVLVLHGGASVEAAL